MLKTFKDIYPRLGGIFVLTVVIPTVCAVLYFGVFASDIFVSEARFIVRSPEKAAPTGLGALIKGSGFNNASDEVFAAQDYIISRDALSNLNTQGRINHAFHNGSIFLLDKFDPFGSGNSFEGLYKYYQGKVKVDHDSTSSITTVTVRAFSPKDARDINLALLTQAEALVNRLSERGRIDLIRFAKAEVEEAKRKANRAALALSDYRNREGILDPERQATVQLQMISKLQDELITSRSQLLQLHAFAPQNPQIPVLRERIQTLTNEIQDQFGQVVGDKRSFAASAARFRRLQLESEFSDRQLAAAMTSLQQAENEARRKQAYVERIVQPNLPDIALEPRRTRGILATLAIGLVAWGILSMLLAGVKEHRD